MFKKIKNLVLTLSLSLIVLVAFQNCSQPKLTLKKNYYSLQSNLGFCTSPSNAIKSNLKFIFVVDRSGSNHTYRPLLPDGTYGAIIPNAESDPLGHRRFTALESFIRGFNSDEEEYLYWSMVSFETGSSEDLPFTNNRSQFLSDIIDEHNDTPNQDDGWTNYINAFTSVNQMILSDVQAERDRIDNNPELDITDIVSSNYVVFFVSDGVPIISDPDDSSSILFQDQDAINSQIVNILDLREGNEMYIDGVQINTAYYYSVFENTSYRNSEAAERLTGMAGYGRGSFLEFGYGENIDFSRFALPLRISRFDLKEFWVTNANTVWEGNELLRDSDADGLSDSLEAQLGSNPQAYDTDSNGVGDGVEYRSSGNTSPCRNADCSFSGIPYSNCGTFDDPETYSFNDLDNDWLNNCEERILNSDEQNPDSNSDYIPDHLAFINQISLTEVSNAAYLDPDNDGFSDYEELKMNTPLRAHNSSINGMKILKYHSEVASLSVERDCFNISISEMAYDTKTDNIRAYIMENTKTLAERRVMRRAVKSLSDGAVSFTEEDFQ
ncbi:MAG: hypothetical protein HOO06_05385 [Bdellovibrionaceae bacterium]|nr:hypothetical protein [Pseudobdellovibrionaceae bacterium]